MTPLADLATRRPLVLLAPAVGIVAAMVALAFAAPHHLSAEPARTSGGARPDLSIVARGRFPARSRVFRVALDTALTGLRTDPAVASARRTAERGHLSLVEVTLTATSEPAREAAVRQIEAEIDPGPLHLDYGGEAVVLASARHSIADELWKLELLALPFVALVLAGLCGAAAGLGAAIAAAGAIGATLVGLRVGSSFSDVSLLGIAPGAVLALVLPVELASLLRSLHREERLISTPTEALANALGGWARLGVPLAVLAGLAPLALLVTPFPATGSLLVGTAVAAASALLLTAAVVPPLLALEARVAPAERAAHRDGRLGDAARGLLGRVASSWIALVVAVVVAVGVPLALAAPARDVETRPFGVADLPEQAQAAASARESTGIATGEPASDVSLSPEPAASDVIRGLGLAAGIAAGALALVLVALARSPKPLVAVPFALLPAAAALGVVAFVIAQGHLAASLGLREEGSLDTGAVGCALAAIAGLSAGRCARDWLAVRREGRVGAGIAGTAELAAGTVLPAVAAASLVAAAAFGVLAGADLYAAREFGLLVAVGLLVDLVLRPPLLALLARVSPGK